MNLTSVSLRNLRVRLLSSSLTTLSILLGTALLAALWLLSSEAERRYTSNVKGYGVVVGPKEGSPLDLVLSTVFNLTDLAPPSGLVPLSVYRELYDGPLSKHGGVLYAIPQCRGDNYKSFPVIGTTDEMFSRFRRGTKGKDEQGNSIPVLLEFAEGEPFVFSHEDLIEFAEHEASHAHDDHHHHHEIPVPWRQAVIGAAVADRLQLGLGDEITPAHGVADEITAHVHDEATCRVVGVLEATDTPLDRSIFIPIGTFLSMSKHDAIRDTQESVADNVGLSAIIVETVRPTPFGQRLRYAFQTRADAQAAWPWFEVSRLLEVVGNAAVILRVVSYLVLAVAGMSILVALYNTMNERRREIAIMRSLGARRLQIIRVILQEALAVSLVGATLGVLTCHVAALVFGDAVADVTGVAVDWTSFSISEVWLILGVGALGGCAGVAPAIKGSLTPVADHLGPIS